MPEVCYIPKKLSLPKLEIIDLAREICDEYAGFSLTLRQLYYQFVARDIFPSDRTWRQVTNDKWVRDPSGTPNAEPNYKWLGDIINDARLAGLFDWEYIIDRTRNLEKRSTWSSPAALLDDAAKQYLTDTWGAQKRRIEVWIEKDAAIGVVEHVCHLNNVPFFSCRGYTSQSEMWAAAQRIGENLRNGEKTLIVHIGDHDPSGLDMTDDITDRLNRFMHIDWVNEFLHPGVTRGYIRNDMREQMREKGCTIEDDELPFEVRRIALTIEQIEQYNPPPNPAKKTDARYQKYQERTGLDESWELDALEPAVVEELIQGEIDAFRDDEAFGRAEMTQEKDRAILKSVVGDWDTIASIHSSKIGTPS